jgi:hypothetical protein
VEAFRRPNSNLDRLLVLNAGMYRTFARLLCAVLAMALLLPGVAAAKIVEIGEVTTDPAPSCPASPCEVISRTTAYQARVAGVGERYVVPEDGRLVAWSISLGAPGRKQRAFFEENLGGPAQAGVTVLKQGNRAFRRVVASSPLQALTPYFGQTVQFPLTTTLAVEKGNIIALTVPTWAPALNLGLERDSTWRASRAKDACDDTQTQSAQIGTAAFTQYKCAYRTARLTYSATIVTTPVPPKPPKPTRATKPSRRG